MQVIDIGDLPLLLTVPHAVKVSGLSRSELYRRMATGSLPRKKVGRSTYIATKALVRMVNDLPE